MEDGVPSAHAGCVVRSRTINHVQHQPASGFCTAGSVLPNNNTWEGLLSRVISSTLAQSRPVIESTDRESGGKSQSPAQAATATEHSYSRLTA